MGAASIVPPHSSSRKHLKHRIWKFPLERQEPEAGPISVDTRLMTTQSWKGQVDTAQSKAGSCSPRSLVVITRSGSNTTPDGHV